MVWQGGGIVSTGGLLWFWRDFFLCTNTGASDYRNASVHRWWEKQVGDTALGSFKWFRGVWWGKTMWRQWMVSSFRGFAGMPFTNYSKILISAVWGNHYIVSRTPLFFFYYLGSRLWFKDVYELLCRLSYADQYLEVRGSGVCYQPLQVTEKRLFFPVTNVGLLNKKDLVFWLDHCYDLIIPVERHKIYHECLHPATTLKPIKRELTRIPINPLARNKKKKNIENRNGWRQETRTFLLLWCRRRGASYFGFPKRYEYAYTHNIEKWACP